VSTEEETKKRERENSGENSIKMNSSKMFFIKKASDMQLKLKFIKVF